MERQLACQRRLLRALRALCQCLIEAAQPNYQQREADCCGAVLCEGGHQRREAVLQATGNTYMMRMSVLLM
jgi:hypothetical protein